MPMTIATRKGWIIGEETGTIGTVTYHQHTFTTTLDRATCETTGEFNYMAPQVVDGDRLTIVGGIGGAKWQRAYTINKSALNVISLTPAVSTL